MLTTLTTRIASMLWRQVASQGIAWAVILVVLALAGCASEKRDEQPAREPTPDRNVLDSAPAPETADDAVRLQNELDETRTKLDNLRDWASAEIDAFRNRAETADAAVGVFGKIAFFAFLAVPIAWFLGGIRAAVIAAAFASAIAFAPTIIGEAWQQVAPLVKPTAAVAAVGFAVYWGFRLWLDMRGRWLERHNEPRAGVAMRATARGMTAANGPAKKWRQARLAALTNEGVPA